MKIKKKDLIRLIESYLYEQDEEAPDEEVEEEPSDEEVEEEPSDEEPDESEEESDESEEENSGDDSKEEKETVEKDKLVTNSFKPALDAIKSGKPFTALGIIKNQIETTFKDVEIKAKDMPEEIKQLLKLDDKKDDEVLNIVAALNNKSLARLSRTKEAQGATQKV
jgi:cobalamin biosynthesis protein CobT